MKASIIVPVYNTAVLLDRCIESLINQSCKDIEILLVDDGSTDNSRQVCAYWAEKDSRVKYIHQENGGLSRARNTGIDNACGQYLCFVDSDDCVSPFFVENLLNMAATAGTKIAVCGYRITDETTTVDMMAVPTAEFITEILDTREYFERIYTDKEIIYVIACNKIFHRSIFDSLRFEKGKLNEDEGIIHRTISQCENIAVNYRPLYFYTMRQGSIMKSGGFRPAKMDILEFWQDRMDYFRQNGWYDLVYFTMKNYLVKCLELYNSIDSETPDGTAYKNLLIQAYKTMLSDMKNNPVCSRKFTLQMNYYGLFPKKFKDVDRKTFLFGN